MGEAAHATGGLASVVIPCCNRLDSIRLGLDALMRHTRPPWELIVVDNGSTDGTAAYLAGIRDSAPVRVEILTNPEDRGFHAACHQGLGIAQGNYVVFLDPQTVVTGAWLDQLVALAESDPAIGLVGPMSNAAAPPQRVEGVPCTDLDAMHRFAAHWRAEHRGQWFTVPTLSSSCLLLKRRVLEVVATRADRLRRRRLALGARQAGYLLAVAHDLFVHHLDGRTSALPGDDAERSGLPAWLGPAVAESRRPRVSLTMIVRDEEANLPACLESAAGLFEELVVVDTGSIDRTAEIARSFGARVFDFVWVDDFAAARNAALARARGDYAFWLDADDVIDPPQRQRLRGLLEGLRDDDEAAYVVRCACDPDPAEGGSATVVDHIRLFPVREDIRWTYRVHEQILPALRRGGVPVRWTDVTVRHTGYSDPRLRRRKLGRDEGILLAELQERPGDPFLLFNLGSIAGERQDWRAALAHLRASLAGSAPDDSITRKLHALIARAHQMLGETKAALAACAAGLAVAPDDAELLFRAAVVHRYGGDWSQAEACWRRILTLRPPERFSSVDAGIYGHLTRRNLAALAEERGDRAEAARLWSEVLAELPGDGEALMALGRLAGAGPAPEEVALWP
jgi:glycosyltransferase involved in cell wall biosynthesis